MITLPYLAFLVISGLYSYTQYDPNLTLFNNTAFLALQNSGIQVGLFMRSYSALAFVLLVIFGFVLYGLAIKRAFSGQFSPKSFLIILIAVSLVGLVAYPAFSKDIFNYIFDAKILSYYHLNPYLFKPLDFPSDNWLRFMTWTHRTYPYGPVWLALTSPLNFVTQNHFVATLGAYKLFFIANYLLSTGLIYKILIKENVTRALAGAAIFALNPLVIYESVISPHLDISMTLFMLLGLYCILFKKTTLSTFFFLLSGGIKFLTLPLVFLPYFKKFNFHTTIKISVITIVSLLIPVIAVREAYAWYFLPVIALASLFVNQKLFSVVIICSLGILLQYLPYIYFGEYIPKVFLYKNLIIISSVILSAIFLLTNNFLFLKNKIYGQRHKKSVG